LKPIDRALDGDGARTSNGGDMAGRTYPRCVRFRGEMYRTIAVAAGDTKRYKLPPSGGLWRKRRGRREALLGRRDCIRMYPGGRKLHPHARPTACDIWGIQAQPHFSTV